LRGFLIVVLYRNFADEIFDIAIKTYNLIQV